MKTKFVLLYFMMALIVYVSADGIYNKTPYDVELPPPLTKEGSSIQVESDITSKPGKAGQTVEYAVEVKNLSDEPQTVRLTFKPDSWAVMPVAVLVKA